jgi:uncharacterized protein (TIGR02001 family)
VLKIQQAAATEARKSGKRAMLAHSIHEYLAPPSKERRNPMSLNKLALALSLAMFALPMSAMAQDATDTTAPAQDTAAPAADAPAAEEPKSNLSWNLSVTSDYVFRGITQTNFDPALQGGLDYAFGDSGWYVGTWASNVDFNDSDGPDIELDAYVGYGTSMSDDWSLDTHVVRYTYLGERSAYGNIDYNEFFVSTTYSDMLTFTLAYAPDYANADFSSTYFSVGGTWEVGNGFNLNAGVGHSKFSDDVGSYTDWNLGVSRSFGPVEAALTYYDTTGNYVDYIFGDHKASDQFVLSFKIGG